MLDKKNRQLKSIRLIGLIIILSIFTNNCYTTTSEVKYTSDNEEYKRAREVKIEKTIGVKGLLTPEDDGSRNWYNNWYRDQGFHYEKNADFGVYELKKFDCENWVNPLITLFTLTIIPNRNKCTKHYTIDSFYKKEKRYTFTFSEVESTYYWILLSILGPFYFLPSDEFEYQNSIFKTIALRKIYDDFLALEAQAKKEELELIAKAAKINVNEILDLRDEKVKKEFLLSWYNSKENPDIENNINYSENEFKYQEDKKKFQNYRSYKYALTNSFRINNDYDFQKAAFQISSSTSDFTDSVSVNSFGARLFEPNKPLERSNTIQSSVWFPIASSKAEKFKEEKLDYKNILLLTKFSSAYHTTTGNCKYPDTYYEIADDEYKECKKKFENKQIKLKYLSTETLQYRIIYKNEEYKNY